MSGPLNTINSDNAFTGTNTFVGQTTLPAGTIVDATVSAGAAIGAAKIIARRSVDVELFGPAVTVAALTKTLHIVKGLTGTLYAAQAAIYVQATGADRTIHVDIQKSTGGGAFATVCGTTISITNATTIFTAVSAIFSSTALVAGDILQAVVTVAGSASAQATGLLLSLTYDEAPI